MLLASTTLTGTACCDKADRVFEVPRVTTGCYLEVKVKFACKLTGV